MAEGQPRDLVVITGASRGIGKATALALAPHFDILGTYHEKEARANETALEVQQLGGNMRFVRADITEEAGRAKLLSGVWDWEGDNPRGKVHLVLNAAGGLEEGKGDYWAQKINTEAQLALVQKFSDSLLGDDEGVIVYPTSIFAHGFLPDELNRHRQFVQPPSYYLVAETKFKTERRLQEMIPQFEAEGRRVVFPIGQLIEGTAAYTLYKRYYKDRLDVMMGMCEGGVLPTAQKYAEAIRELIMGDYPNGHRLFVGGDQAELVDPVLAGEYTLDRTAIKGKLPMYGDNKLYADAFRSPKGSKRFGELDFTVRPIDTDGHFGGDYSDIQLYRGVDETEMAGQAVGLALLSMEPKAGFVPVYQEYHSKLISTVVPGEKITAKAEVTSFTGKSARGKADLFVGDRKVSEHDNLVFGLIPDIDTARRLLQKQRAK